MRVIIQTEKLKKLVEVLLTDDYLIPQSLSADIAGDIEKIIIENEDD